MTNWRAYSAQRSGLSHIAKNTACQDRVVVRETPEILVAALADGLGSLKYSELAAETATQTLCEMLLSEKLQISGKRLNTMLADGIQNAIRKRAAEQQVSTSEMDCTLVFVFIAKAMNMAVVGRLGDSAVCLIGRNSCQVLSDSGGFANATAAILDPDAAEVFDISIHDLQKEQLLGFILTSDGLDNEIYVKGGGAYVCKNAELYLNAVSTAANPGAVIDARLDELTADPDSPFDDDISLAVLSCTAQPVSLPEDPNWLCTCGARNPMHSTLCCRCGNDFTELYRGVNFTEAGGKAAFFRRVNQNPDEEQRILQQPAANGRDYDGFDISAVFADMEAENAPEPVLFDSPCRSDAPAQPQKKTGAKKLIIVGAACLGLLLVLAIILLAVRGRHSAQDAGQSENAGQPVSQTVETVISAAPSAAADAVPTAAPSPAEPTAEPTAEPAAEPTAEPAAEPMAEPSADMPAQEAGVTEPEEAIPGEEGQQSGTADLWTEEELPAEDNAADGEILPGSDIAFVNVDSASLREGPGTAYDTIRILGYNQQVYITDAEAVAADGYTWVYVTSPADENGAYAFEGWIAEELLTRITA